MSEKKPTLVDALIPISVLITLLALNVYFFGDNSSYGPNQMALILAAALGGGVAVKNKISWETLLNGIVSGIGSAMPAILILLLIGALASTWLLSGIVPTMIYYGLKILNPSIFLVAACAVCAIVSLATGSSWSTVATIGIALIGIGETLNIPSGIVAGAIISGAYFGDKMSPLSDTTNLAPAMAGTDLVTHIRYMMFTTIPTIIITLIIFGIMGFFGNSHAEAAEIEEILVLLENRFTITPLLFIVPALVVILIVLRMPALPALLIGALLGGIFAFIFQQHLIMELAKSENIYASGYTIITNTMATGVTISTDNVALNKLLSHGGMNGMLNTVWLIICAMIFGGVMEAAGLLQRITQSLVSLAHSTGSLIATTAGTCVFFNTTTSDQYLAIVVTGRMFSETYKERGLAPENLSRTLEDSGTVTSVLVPWNTCGATQAGVLGVATLTYLPYCFFNIISPFMTILYGYLGIKIAKITSN